ncbi:hypothetical protein D9V41_04645 [Aeromicrobium phragmitis]|uniref:Uncharacterized protein n=1 Tax=Aeromicrobium phragmitis TaxID=2478914 RepID=A0A3L8PMD4_9ACTN|nr:hypothetical protein D9V41_04645 [Aeromicrobium phragmitis]
MLHRAAGARSSRPRPRWTNRLPATRRARRHEGCRNRDGGSRPLPPRRRPRPGSARRARRSAVPAATDRCGGTWRKQALDNPTCKVATLHPATPRPPRRRVR